MLGTSQPVVSLVARLKTNATQSESERERLVLESVLPAPTDCFLILSAQMPRQTWHFTPPYRSSTELIRMHAVTDQHKTELAVIIRY